MSEGVPFIRINTDTICRDTKFKYTVGSPSLEFQGDVFKPYDFQNVWYRRPEPLQDDRYLDEGEAKFAFNEWGAALEGFFSHIPREKWMNHPARNFKASNKLEQLTTASSLGFEVPATLVTQDPSCLRTFYRDHSGQVIAKPLYQGYIDNPNGNDYLVYTNQIKDSDLADMSDLRLCPTLFQEFVPKLADYRITVVDGDIHVAELLAKDTDGNQRCDIRRNNMEDVSTSKSELPHDVMTRIKNLMEHYALRFGAIDMALTQESKWIFFEINPNGQWAWLDMVSDLDIASSFVNSFRGQIYG
jgi:hypothetical protein